MIVKVKDISSKDWTTASAATTKATNAMGTLTVSLKELGAMSNWDLLDGRIPYGKAVRKKNEMLDKIKNVIFNNPATIVFWADGTKTVVKCENEDYDPEKGLAMAIVKKVMADNHSYYNDIFKKWLPKKRKETN